MAYDKKLTWFQLMWQNGYIFTFSLAIAFLTAAIILKDTFYSLGGFLIGISIPIGMMIIIGYKGFYQFWNDYKQGKSR